MSNEIITDIENQTDDIRAGAFKLAGATQDKQCEALLDLIIRLTLLKNRLLDLYVEVGCHLQTPQLQAHTTEIDAVSSRIEALPTPPS